MKRRAACTALLGTVGLLGAAPPPAVGLDVKIVRSSNALLEPVTFTLTLHNPGPLLQATFLTADLYQIQVADAASTVWDSLYLHRPIVVTHTVPIAPGTSVLTSYVWDGRTDDRRSLAPGHYRVRASLLGSLLHPSADLPIEFAAPTPIAAALAAKTPEPELTLAAKPEPDVTIAGTPEHDAQGWHLVDASGAIALSRALGLRAQGQWIVRGHVTTTYAGTQFVVSQFAPAFDNLTPSAPPPTPAPLPSTTARAKPPRPNLPAPSP